MIWYDMQNKYPDIPWYPHKTSPMRMCIYICIYIYIFVFLFLLFLLFIYLFTYLFSLHPMISDWKIPCVISSVFPMECPSTIYVWTTSGWTIIIHSPENRWIVRPLAGLWGWFPHTFTIIPVTSRREAVSKFIQINHHSINHPMIQSLITINH
jgi:hypothetical protein